MEAKQAMIEVDTIIQESRANLKVIIVPCYVYSKYSQDNWLGNLPWKSLPCGKAVTISNYVLCIEPCLIKDLGWKCF